jgi:hypothetical protein
MTADRRAVQAARLLRANGFLISDVHYGAGFATFVATRIDDLGVHLRYVIGVFDANVSEGPLRAMKQSADYHQASLVTVADDVTDQAPSMSWSDLVARFGGVIPSLLPLERGYLARLRMLGTNRRPPDLAEGAVDRLYEAYVGASLEFLLGSRVIRYGSERLFEPVPDGVLLPSTDRVAILYDAKAADPAFTVSRDDVRRFGDYVRRFDESYRVHVGPARSMVVVSSEFSQDRASRMAYSNQLQADVGVPMSFLRSDELAEITTLLGAKPWMRTAIRWREIFTQLDVTAGAVGSAIATISADLGRG